MNLPRSAVFIALALAAFSARGQGNKSPFGDEEPAYNDLVARSFFIEVEPLVEKHTGWECEWPVPFKLVTRKQFVDITLADLRKRLGNEYAGVPQASVDSMLRQALLAHSMGLLGLYTPTSRSILLLPGNLKPVLREIKVEQRYSRDVIEVILAHELTHSVQDAQCKITDRALAIQNEEESAAWTMLIEGHASWVADRVASDLKLDEAAARMAEGMAAVAVTNSNPKSRSATDARQRGYTQGKKFVDEVFKKGGLAAVQRLFVKPPINTAEVDTPDLFFKRQ